MPLDAHDVFQPSLRDVQTAIQVVYSGIELYALWLLAKLYSGRDIRGYANR